MTDIFTRGWSKRREHWRLRIGGQTVALAVPSGLHWKALGFVDGQTVLCRIFDDEATAMEAAEGWAKDASSHSSRKLLQ
ncbi:hypothetical protein ACFOYU_11490 [Microvirga sp. GCM10011540]|uniref:hypothetical protein n=1 Tax=Microvirga sp. GCM10011540 TaxID=3317338 RepID=UPI0036154C47